MNAGAPIRDALIEHALGCREVPNTALASTRIFLEDTIMVGLAGGSTQGRARLVEALGAAASADQARLWGDGQPQPAATAALINAYQIHCQEFDCVHEPAVVHPMAVIGGAVMSWAQAHGPVSGRELLSAIAIGVDVAATLGMMARTPMRFFRPAMCGALGASLAIARLSGFDPTRARRALGLTYCQISGNMQSHVEGSPGLALQIGVNARAAVQGAELTLAGVQGPEDVIDGPFGYLNLIEQDFDLDPAADFGSVFRIEQVSHKPYPTGRAAHAALDGLDQLMREGLTAADIKHIELQAPPLVRRLVNRPAHPDMNSSYARLCLPWLMSVRLARGQVDLDDFSPAALGDPDRWAFTDRVTVVPDSNTDPNALTPQILRITTRNGAEREIPLSTVLGSPQRPLDKNQREAKAKLCWRFAGLPDQHGQALLTLLRGLDHQPNLDSLFDLLTPRPQGQ